MCIFLCIYFVVFVFLYFKNIYLVFRIPGFQRNVTNIYIYIYIYIYNVFMYTTNTLTCFEPSYLLFDHFYHLELAICPHVVVD
jgi:hypothetical protein